MTDDASELPPDLLEEAQRYELRIAADLHKLDADFQLRYANADPEAKIPMLERYCVQRFDAIAAWSSPLAASKNPGAIGPHYEPTLLAAKEKGLEFLAAILKSQPEEVQREVRSRVALKLEAFRQRWLGEVKAKHLERLPPPASTPVRTVTAAVIKRRKQLVRQYRDERSLSAVDFARKAGMSDTAVRGIVREERKRFATDAQMRLLRTLGITTDEWYRP